MSSHHFESICQNNNNKTTRFSYLIYLSLPPFLLHWIFVCIPNEDKIQTSVLQLSDTDIFPVSAILVMKQ